jgi:Protein of unknown function (DUF2569)
MKVPSDSTSSRLQGPSGIGGWMLVPIYGFLVAMWNSSRELTFALSEKEYVSVLSLSDAEKLTQYKWILLFYYICLVAIYVTAVICLILVVLKNRHIVILAVTHYVFIVLPSLTVYYLFFLMTGAGLEFSIDEQKALISYFESLFLALVFVIYFKTSKRVKNTVVEKNAGDGAMYL